MDGLKPHLFATVVATQVAALLSGSVPYFPIEISRTAASGTLPALIFTVGACAAAFWAFLKSTSVAVCLTCAGIACLALFDDVRHLALHFVGLGAVFLGACVAVWTSPSPSNRLVLLLAAAALYVFRIVLKVAMIVLYEFESLPGRDFAPLVRRYFDIQYRGEAACTAPHLVMPAFRIGAVLQWVVFYTLSFVF